MERQVVKKKPILYATNAYLIGDIIIFLVVGFILGWLQPISHKLSATDVATGYTLAGLGLGVTTTIFRLKVFPHHFKIFVGLALGVGWGLGVYLQFDDFGKGALVAVCIGFGTALTGDICNYFKLHHLQNQNTP